MTLGCRFGVGFGCEVELDFEIREGERRGERRVGLETGFDFVIDFGDGVQCVVGLRWCFGLDFEGEDGVWCRGERRCVGFEIVDLEICGGGSDVKPKGLFLDTGIARPRGCGLVLAFLV